MELRSAELRNLRIIQWNLVYISGLPEKMLDKELLSANSFLGQYGKIKKIDIKLQKNQELKET